MKFTPPGTGSGHSQGRGRTPPSIPLEVITEIRERGYLDLICGHFCSKETQLQYLAFRPKGKQKYFCERCGSWESLKEKKVRDIPDKPLF